MEALKFNAVCNKCDDNIYEAAQAIVDGLNSKLESFDPHSTCRISVQGHQTGRYIKLSLAGQTEEAINATENVFLSAGYFTVVVKDGADSVMYVVFDSDIAPGSDDEAEPAATPEEMQGGSGEPAVEEGAGEPEPEPEPSAEPQGAEEQEGEPAAGSESNSGFYGG